ncbi:hypothetical protein SPI_04764 [Niveomyces insectorum RCEF 264]|uniref:SRR1-like domain-containing protein n=1 Tax=Niveomyces insectorum RCEF 264 TaxID=1081102 RepID=A0A167UTU6_9HYPO|nr:hypothetical protein SPI_04764 [Niveomyces insectorum RCEF 264]
MASPTSPASLDAVRNGGDEEDTPWTFVAGRKGRRKGRCAVDTALRFHAHAAGSQPGQRKAAAPAAPAADTIQQSVEHIRTDHARIAAKWRGQPSCRRLEERIAAAARLHATVTQAVCLGAGSFGGPLDGGEHVRRAHVQTAAFLLIVDMLRQHCNATIPCFFQEPLYTEADCLYLRSLGHSVIEAPAASHMITRSTLVFAIHLPTRGYLDCLARSPPAMLIGTSYGCYEGLPQFAESRASQMLDNLRDVDATFDGFAFPREEHDHCFSDTWIYWRPAEAAVSVTGEPG